MFMKICPRCQRARIPITEQACPKCLASRNQRHKAYDAFDRDETSTAFYKSVAWVKLRSYVLDKHNHLDLYDLYINKRLTKATHVHHIIPLKDEPELGLTESNLFPLSAANHSRIEAEYKTGGMETMQHTLREILRKYSEGRGVE